MEDETELKLLQSQSDDIYTAKANGAYIRSRARWIEKGEKSSAYFFGLEKQRQTKRKISKLMTNDKVVLEVQKLIQDEICLFYCNLYKSKFNKSECDILFESISEDIKKLDAEDEHILEEELTITETENALEQINSKSPGINGLMSEFLKHFWVDIRKLLYKAFLECIQKGCLSPTMKTGLITLLPKTKRRFVDAGDQ